MESGGGGRPGPGAAGGGGGEGLPGWIGGISTSGSGRVLKC